jgi:hypothetical protein
VLGLPPLRRNRRTKNITIFKLYQYTNCRWIPIIKRKGK